MDLAGGGISLDTPPWRGTEVVGLKGGSGPLPLTRHFGGRATRARRAHMNVLTTH